MNSIVLNGTDSLTNITQSGVYKEILARSYRNMKIFLTLQFQILKECFLNKSQIYCQIKLRTIVSRITTPGIWRKVCVFARPLPKLTLCEDDWWKAFFLEIDRNLMYLPERTDSWNKENFS